MAARERIKAAARKQQRADADPRASLRFLRMAPQKVRLVADLIRGRSVNDAVSVLTFSKKAAARPLAKLLKSAIANADTRDMDVDTLVVQTAFVDEGPTWRRWLPRAMGRATRIRKRTSHVTLVLGTS